MLLRGDCGLIPETHVGGGRDAGEAVKEDVEVEAYGLGGDDGENVLVVFELGRSVSIFADFMRELRLGCSEAGGGYSYPCELA